MSNDDFNLSKRKYVLGAAAVLIVVIYIARLFILQLTSDDYKARADSNALMRRIQFPARGAITDRNGKLLVYNQPAYDIMVIMQEQIGVDTLDLCESLGIDTTWYQRRMAEIKDRNRNPGYSRFTQQLFMGQLSAAEFSNFQEKLFRFPGFYVQKRSIRQYAYPYAAHILGDVGEVSPKDIERDDYYRSGDYIGTQGIERSYERQLRGIKGSEILLRDVHGRIKGRYQDGRFDQQPIPGKNLTLSIDIELQKLGERLMKGKLGSIVAIEPSTGEILCMVTSPTYDPRTMVGRQRGKRHRELSLDPMKPLLNRAIMGTYPPGSTFKTSQALTFLEEGIITPQTAYPCSGWFPLWWPQGWLPRPRLATAPHPRHRHLVQRLLLLGPPNMLQNRTKYSTVQEAMTTWKDYMVSMGFGYPIGIDLPGEARGMIPNADYYDKAYKGSWSGLTVISISIGQGEVTLTPLQIANLGATIANRGWFITPHIVKEMSGRGPRPEIQREALHQGLTCQL